MTDGLLRRRGSIVHLSWTWTKLAGDVVGFSSYRLLQRHWDVVMLKWMVHSKGDPPAFPAVSRLTDDPLATLATHSVDQPPSSRRLGLPSSRRQAQRQAAEQVVYSVTRFASYWFFLPFEEKEDEKEEKKWAQLWPLNVFLFFSRPAESIRCSRWIVRPRRRRPITNGQWMTDDRAAIRAPAPVRPATRAVRYLIINGVTRRPAGRIVTISGTWWNWPVLPATTGANSCWDRMRMIDRLRSIETWCPARRPARGCRVSAGLTLCVRTRSMSRAYKCRQCRRRITGWWLGPGLSRVASGRATIVTVRPYRSRCGRRQRREPDQHRMQPRRQLLNVAKRWSRRMRTTWRKSSLLRSSIGLPVRFPPLRKCTTRSSLIRSSCGPAMATRSPATLPMKPAGAGPSSKRQSTTAG